LHLFYLGGQRNNQKTKGKTKRKEEEKPALTLHGQTESMLRDHGRENHKISGMISHQNYQNE
jgi:hypothetical protein